jgi:hypothetical protein
MSKEIKRNLKDIEKKELELGPKDLIKKFLQSDSLEDLQVLWIYLNTFEESIQKIFANDFELRKLALENITREIVNSSKSKTKNQENNSAENSQKISEDEKEELLNNIAGFFHICLGK